jgi:hypothetical protein
MQKADPSLRSGWQFLLKFVLSHFRAARYELQVLFAPLRNDNTFYTLEERKGPAFLQALSCFWLEG